MKRILLGMLAALTALAWPAVAMADIADPGGIRGGGGLVWILVIAVVIIAAVVLFFVLRKNKK